MGFENISGYDDTDESLQGIRRDIRDATSKIKKGQEASLKNDELMLAAFNKIAASLGDLATEIRGLREDLSPRLDKPKHLQAPGSQP